MPACLVCSLPTHMLGTLGGPCIILQAGGSTPHNACIGAQCCVPSLMTIFVELHSDCGLICKLVADQPVLCVFCMADAVSVLLDGIFAMRKSGPLHQGGALQVLQLWCVAVNKL
eukprot:GHRR01026376.1.p1 GENE.GHRR01026376.1~~GHRR01026376.1.p1  ORF type:complete len:114 (-),score=18.42 GHRR01026376.1:72-413(-)